jgi:catechol 2,3-dioxygenase-like lactoylglutathione lyase family enzyme
MLTLAAFTLLVEDYDPAIAYYCGVLGFKLVQDERLSAHKRWVKISPNASSKEMSIILARASDETQHAMIGRQGGGRVWLFLHTDDFWRDYHEWLKRGVHFIEAPRHESYGIVAVFEDLYQNRWDLIQVFDSNPISYE